MPCFHCHVVIKLPASHSAFMLGTKKTWPNKVKRRLGLPIESRADANRRAAVRAGNARPEAWGKQRPDTIESWQEWAFKSEQYWWGRKQSVACWSKHPLVAKRLAMVSYYRDHEAGKARSRENARKTYNARKNDPQWIAKRRAYQKARDAANPEYKRKKRKEWIERNPEKYKEAIRKNKAKPINRVYANMRQRLRDVFRGKRPARAIVGCSKLELEKHLQSQFTEKMRWNNYGTYWHVDHIIPLSHFDPYNEQHARIANHWTNLRPLEAAANIRRGNRMKETVQIALPF